MKEGRRKFNPRPGRGLNPGPSGWQSETQGSHPDILTTGNPSEFFGFEILTKSDFLGSMKYAEISLGSKKKQRDFLGVAKKGLRDFGGMLKM